MALTRTKTDIVGTLATGALAMVAKQSNSVSDVVFVAVNPDSRVYAFLRASASNAQIQGQAYVRVFYAQENGGASLFYFNDFILPIESYKQSDFSLDITHPLISMFTHVGVQLVAAKASAPVDYYLGVSEVSAA